jgi:DNA-binding NarL/FixJ family response regulator
MDGPPRPGSRSHGPRRLTDRQLEVLEALRDRDGSIKEAARELGISEQTVKGHLTTIYERLGVTRMVGAFRALGWMR